MLNIIKYCCKKLFGCSYIASDENGIWKMINFITEIIF